MEQAIAEQQEAYIAEAQFLPADELNKLIKELERQMKNAAEIFEFEKAAEFRDQLRVLRETQLLQKSDGKTEKAWDQYRK